MIEGEHSVLLENLRTLSSKDAESFELRICELSDAADEMYRDIKFLLDEGLDFCEALTTVSENIVLAEAFDSFDAMKSNRDRMNSHFILSNSEDKAIFASLLAEKLKSGGILLRENDILLGNECEHTFTYVKGALADEAYDVFSQSFEDARVAYSGSFKEAAVSTVERKVGFCILPLEEKSGSRIPTIMNMIFSYDLKINSVTPVFGFDGDADIKYALLSSSFIIPDYDEGDDRYLEILLPQQGEVDILDVSLSCKMLASQIYRFNTISFDTDEGRIPYFSVIFRTDKSSFSDLLIYLSVFCKGYISVGLYKNLE